MHYDFPFRLPDIEKSEIWRELLKESLNHELWVITQGFLHPPSKITLTSLCNLIHVTHETLFGVKWEQTHERTRQQRQLERQLRQPAVLTHMRVGELGQALLLYLPSSFLLMQRQWPKSLAPGCSLNKPQHLRGCEVWTSTGKLSVALFLLLRQENEHQQKQAIKDRTHRTLPSKSGTRSYLAFLIQNNLIFNNK